MSETLLCSVLSVLSIINWSELLSLDLCRTISMSFKHVFSVGARDHDI